MTSGASVRMTTIWDYFSV